MLSQITPVAETGRQQRFGRTAAWFVVGAVLGGLTLGLVVAAGAGVLGAVGLGEGTAVGLVAVGAFASAAVDARLFGFGPPFFRRQVNEDWLSNYRPWVYGGGFGWQIGAGVTTYVMTAAVPLMILIGVLTGRPWAAVAIGGVFGLTRGLPVLLGAPAKTVPALHALHRRFSTWSEPVRVIVIGVQLAVAVTAAWRATAPLGALVVAVGGIAVGGIAVVASTRESRRSRMAEIV
jgi:hypothetical protein